jgi:hypothetical protein
MVSASAVILNYVFPTLGSLIGFGLCLSPLKAVQVSAWANVSLVYLSLTLRGLAGDDGRWQKRRGTWGTLTPSPRVSSL